ncbi:(2Fe-2S)-binding protein [Tardiphaga sp.]|uniref:(2Fe-2S)-binding protein n=1 Tax=Tardiphaga sp. TaxID=1926292 RepID=UPI00352A3976
MTRYLSLDVDNKKVQVHCDEDVPALYVLRNDLALNGPKFGCGLGQCGACVVLVDGNATRSCVTPVSALEGTKVVTLDGLAVNGKLDALQRAFIQLEAAQCGYCTNGMIMTAKALLLREKHPSEEQIRSALNGNLCRCGVHNRIVAAVQMASMDKAQ